MVDCLAADAEFLGQHGLCFPAGCAVDQGEDLFLRERPLAATVGATLFRLGNAFLLAFADECTLELGVALVTRIWSL